MLSYLLNFDSTSKHTNAKIAHVYAKHLFKSSGIIRKAENNINKINLWETYYVPVSEYLCKINVTAVQRLYRFSIHKTSWKLKFPFTPFFLQIFLFKLITWSYLEKLKLNERYISDSITQIGNQKHYMCPRWNILHCSTVCLSLQQCMCWKCASIFFC